MSDIRDLKQQKIFERLANRFESKIKDSVSADEKQAVTHFLEGAFGADSLQSSAAYSDWLYDQFDLNKQYLAWDKGEVTGCQAELGCQLNSPQGELDAAWAIDLSVRDDWKMKGLGVALIKKLMDQNPLVMGLGISSAAQAMFRKLGWHDLGQVNCYIKPLSATGFSNIQQNNLLKSKIIFPFAAWAIRTLTKLKLHLKPGYTEKTLSDFESQEKEFKRLLNTQNEIPSTYGIKKDIKHLQWRFSNNPFTSHRYIINALYKGKNLEAYVVSKVTTWKEKKVLAICDYFGPPHSYLAMINVCERKALEANADAIFYQGINTEFEHHLQTSLFIQRPHGDIFMLHRDESLQNTPEILNRDNWHITLSDSDMDFMFFQP